MVFEQRMQVERLLQRFFSKLYSEALHLSADKVLFELCAEELAVVVRRGESALKESRLNKRWASVLKCWLVDRDISWWCRALAETTIDQDHFCGLLRGEEFLFAAFGAAAAQDNAHEPLVLDSFTSLAKRNALSRLILGDFVLAVFDKISKLDTDIILAAAPTEVNAGRAAALLLTITGAPSLGNVLSHAAGAASVEAALRDGSLVGHVTAADPVQAFVACPPALRQYVAAVLCMDFMPRLCPYCAVQESDAQRFLRMLPGELRSQAGKWRRRGQGCQRCMGRGISGEIPLQSILIAGDAVTSLVKSGISDHDLQSRLYERDIRPLLVDGLQKAAKGAVALRDVVERINFESVAVQDAWRSRREPVAGDSYSTLFDPSSPGNLCELENSEELNCTGNDESVVATQHDNNTSYRPLVLVVEDDEDQQRILELVLNSAGYAVLQACNGQEAIHCLKKSRPDIILTDIMMPEMDGLEMLASLKANSLYRSIPVLVLTVVSDVDKEFEMLDAGADDYCEKSVQRKILLKRIENLLRRSGKSEPGKSEPGKSEPGKSQAGKSEAS